ncbi:MAG: DNA methyltransferase [Acidimicrobiales bacterium]
MTLAELVASGRATCTVEEAAEVVGVGRGTAYDAARSGELRALIAEDNGTPNDGRDVVDGVDLISDESNAPTDETPDAVLSTNELLAAPLGARWQLLPDLGAEDFAALKASIAESGVLIPITYDAETNDLIDGHQRLRAVTELRAEGTVVPEPMKQLRHFSSDEERITFVVTSNVQRRKLSSAQRRDLVAEALRRLPSLSDRRLALMSGVDGKTVAAVRNELEGRAEIPHVETRADTLGRQQPARRVRSAPTIFVQSNRDADRAVKAFQALGDDAPPKLIALSRAESRARDARLAQLRSVTVPPKIEGPAYELRLGDLREVWADVPDGSIDAAVVDPPYSQQFIPLFEDVGSLLARVLKPGRLAAIYCGHMSFPEEIRLLEAGGLAYVWLGVNVLGGQHANIRSYMINVHHRPVLLHSAGKFRQRRWIHDTFFAEGRGGPESRPDHKWQQAVEPMQHWVRMTSELGETVFDPCCGSGTTALAAVTEGRRFLGGDLDPACVETTRRRLVELEEGRLVVAALAEGAEQ